MKPKWERTVYSVTAENFFALTGCMDIQTIRLLLLIFVHNLFDDDSIRDKGFTFVRISGVSNIEVVYHGKIVDLEFWLQPIGTGMPRVWYMHIASLDAEASGGVFEKVLKYLEKGTTAISDVSANFMADTERQLHKKLRAFTSLTDYNEYISSQL